MIAGGSDNPWGRRMTAWTLAAILCGAGSMAWADEDPQEGGDDAEVSGEETAVEVQGADSLDPEAELFGEDGGVEGPRLPTADLEAPEDADPEFEAQLEGYREAYERYAAAIEEYQTTIQNVVQTEFDRRVAEIDAAYDPQIRAATMLEEDRRGEAIGSLENFLGQYPDDPDHTPDAMFRLALLYDQLEQADFENRRDQYFDLVDNAGPDDEIPEFPERDYDRSRPLLDELVVQWPDYRGIDLAHYLLAHIEWEQNNWREARDRAAELIRQVPDSDFVAHAWLMVGEYYFEYADHDEPEEIRNNLRQALAAFREAGSEHGRQNLTDDNYVRVVYTWAWTHYRLEDYPEAIDVFKTVVELIDDLERTTGQQRELLRRDALAHLGEIIAMEDWDLSAAPSMDDSVMARIEEHLSDGHDYQREVLVIIGDELVETLRFDEAIEVYNYALEVDPLHPDNPEVHAKIVAALQRDYRPEEAIAVRREIIDYYGEGSAWHTHQQRMGNEGALRAADGMAREYLLTAATWYHRQAQMSRNEALAARDEALLTLTHQKYARAADAYREFLERYPHDSEAYQWNFNYAETLYYSEQYGEAYEQYRVVRELDIPDNPFQEASAFNAIQALEFVMRDRIERGELTPLALGGVVQDDDEMDEARQFDEERELGQVTVEGMPVPAIVTDYVTAMDRYVVLGLENEHDDYLNARFAFRAATVYYDFLHYDEARRRYAWLVDQFPEHEVAYLAGSRILESLRRENDFEGMTEWAERLEDVITGDQAEVVREEIREFRLTVMFRSAQEMFAEGRLEEAAAEFIRLAREAPEHRLAPRARNNAAYVLEVAGAYDEAIEQYEELFTRYPDDDLASRAVFRVAVNSEWIFDFEKAVRHYQLFYDTYDGPTPEALQELNFDIEESRQFSLSKAAYIQKFQQDYRGAAESLEKYFEIYPESDDAAEVLWSASVAWERAGDENQMVRVLNQYLREYGDDWDRSERIVRAHQRMAKMYEDRGDQRRAEAKYEEIIDLHDHLMGGEEEEFEPPPGAAAIREMAARSQFMLIEPDFEEWDAIAIRGTPNQQERLLTQKVEGAQELREAYQKVFQYNNLDWNMAAFFRRANVQHQFAAALYDVPVPYEEGSDEYWIYQDMIDDILFPMEEQAIESYEEVLSRARNYDPPIANEWTERTIIALHFFRPQEYPLFKDEKRPRRESFEMGIPLLSQGEYERRMERRDVQDDQQLEMPDVDEQDIDGEEQ